MAKKKHPLREAARGKPCLVRTYSGKVHNHDPATVVLHHCRSKTLFGIGMGQKPNDIFGARACAICHDIIHHPNEHEMDPVQVQIDEYEGILRTQNELIKEGLI